MPSNKKEERRIKQGLFPGDQFTTLPYMLLRSDAWRDLSGNAMKVFFELHTRYNGHNNGELALSLLDAAELLGMSKSTAQRAFNELREKGLIRLRRPGQYYGRMASEWELETKPYKGPVAAHSWKKYASIRLKSKMGTDVNHKMPNMVRRSTGEKNLGPAEYLLEGFPER